MDFWDLLFGAGPAVRQIMGMGFMPKDEDFLELTPEQYKKYYDQEGYTEEKVYALLPKDPAHYVSSEYSELNVCTESDIAAMKRGWQIVENYCIKSGKTFATEQQKLAYAASKLPDVFSKGTRFECMHNKNMEVTIINDSGQSSNTHVKLHSSKK